MPLDAPLRPVARAEETVFEVRTDLGAIDRQQWNACFPGEAEGYDYLLAVERAGIPGFEFRYVIGQAGGRIVVAMPAFLTRYGLETTLDNRHLRDAVMRLRSLWSGFLMLPLACLGSPCTETGYPGFHPDISAAHRAELFDCLVAAFESHARAASCPLLALKDIPKPLPDGLADVVTARGYAELAGLPTGSIFSASIAFFTLASETPSSLAMTPTVMVACSVKIDPLGAISRCPERVSGRFGRVNGEQPGSLPDNRVGQGRPCCAYQPFHSAVSFAAGPVHKGRSLECLKSFVHGIHGCSHSREDIRHLGYFSPHTIVPACRARGVARPVRPAVGWPLEGCVAAEKTTGREKGGIWRRLWAGSSGIVGRIRP